MGELYQRGARSHREIFSQHCKSVPCTAAAGKGPTWDWIPRAKRSKAQAERAVVSSNPCKRAARGAEERKHFHPLFLISLGDTKPLWFMLQPHMRKQEFQFSISSFWSPNFSMNTVKKPLKHSVRDTSKSKNITGLSLFLFVFQTSCFQRPPQNTNPSLAGIAVNFLDTNSIT